MRNLKAWHLLFSSLLLVSGPAFCEEEEGEEEQELDWKGDHKGAMGAAAAADVPLFIVFVRDNNNDCKRMERTFKDKEVIENLLDKCILCRLDADQQDSKHIMNVYKIQGTGIPFMALIGRDRTLKGSYGGYVTPAKLLEVFNDPLVQAMKEREKTGAEILLENKELGDRATSDRRYAKALHHYQELLRVAQEMKVIDLISDTKNDIQEVEKKGEAEVFLAKQRVDKKEYAPAIAILKLVQVEFKGRKAAEDAASALEAIKANPEAAPLVESTPAAEEGFDLSKVPVPGKGKPKKAPKPPKLIRITLKDGTQLVGAIVAKSGDQIFFRPQSDDPKKAKPQSIKLADIASQEPVSEQ